ncbi:SLC13 family permease [Jiella pacifica]|uniref:DASS family sodium-coupled anion symporter n=1 Tax=Jiella pacifica TaxID=2696469 RepID=A0A6N9SY03_9HYPH|nr:DASS family sodium-coupled anion symporter [Jiella pacifica]NDW03963.1 DASS family sodium-coupled anion symporter [Jiella pacifica]
MSSSGKSQAEGTSEDTAPTLKPLSVLAGLAVFVVLLLLPSPEGLSIEAWRVVAVASLMIVWWITEAIPVAATALVPLVLFPLLGAVEMDAAAAPYADPIVFLFMGGFMLARAMEKWNLHRRVALNIVARTGSRQHMIVGGFMLATAFLSMWVSNTATTVMMLPIALSVARLLEGETGSGKDIGSFALALLLGVAYAASIGGVATLIGTPPNALLAGSLSQQYGYDLGFGRWMLIGLPVAVIMLAISWLLLTRFLVRLDRGEIAGASQLISEKIAELGNWSRGEAIVGIVFVLAALLWIGRSFLDDIIPGLDDTGIAIGAALVLFLVPAAGAKGGAVLDWKTAADIPWGVLLLFGGGLSLAKAVSSTGLDEWIGEALGSFAGVLPLIGLVLVVALVILLLTEFTSNTATAATFLPLVAALSLDLGENPLMLSIPAALAASMAFMLPVATPPNALVFASGKVTIPQMVRYGAFHNLAALVVISTVGYLALTTLFGVTVGEIPDWASSGGSEAPAGRTE